MDVNCKKRCWYRRSLNSCGRSETYCAFYDLTGIRRGCPADKNCYRYKEAGNERHAGKT